VTLETLRSEPAGVRVPLQTHHRKFAEVTEGTVRGFDTPSRRIEFYSERLMKHGGSPIAEFVEPLMSPRSRPDLAARFPLILTCTNSVRASIVPCPAYAGARSIQRSRCIPRLRNSVGSKPVTG
jgi:hypothetical protein